MIVLGTHIWLRWIIQSGCGLPAGILAAIPSEPCVAVSAISCFEVPYLLKRRRITLPVPVAEWLRDALSPAGIESLPVSWKLLFVPHNCQSIIPTPPTASSLPPRWHTMPAWPVWTALFRIMKNWLAD